MADTAIGKQNEGSRYTTTKNIAIATTADMVRVSINYIPPNLRRDILAKAEKIKECAARAKALSEADIAGHRDKLDARIHKMLDDHSIQIDEHNEDEIYKAIEKLRDDKVLRNRLSNGAIKKAESLTIERRAKKFKGFLSNRLG